MGDLICPQTDQARQQQHRPQSPRTAREALSAREWSDFTSAIERAATQLADTAIRANIYGHNNPHNQEAYITMMLGSLLALERLRHRIQS